jgi:UDP-N-acetylglucosamine--N-acetylmuramyl-(pentapeptide) pyrophosphoryl-undecaprenol N-acetylglucosamine transferase
MAYERAGVAHEVHTFLDDMGRAYALANLAVARSGAGTCAELSACGVPALLVPLPTAARDHQSANAAAMQATGGVDVMAERELTATTLADYLDRCRKSPEKLCAMRRALESHRVEGAADRLADLVESCARRPRH